MKKIEKKMVVQYDIYSLSASVWIGPCWQDIGRFNQQKFTVGIKNTSNQMWINGC